MIPPCPMISSGTSTLPRRAESRLRAGTVRELLSLAAMDGHGQRPTHSATVGARSVRRRGAAAGWRLDSGRAAAGSGTVIAEARARGPGRAADARRCPALGRWDSVLPAFLFELAAGATRPRARRWSPTVRPRACGGCWRSPWPCRRAAIPATAAPGRGLVARIGLAFLRWWDGIVDAVTFIGEVILALLAFLRGRAQFRTEDVARVFYAAGPAALPIVTLIGLLAGFILAFIRRQPAGAVRRADLRRQPGHHRHGAGDGPADGGGDHGRPHRRRVRGRARHDAGQPGDRRAAHARDRPDPVSWSCRGCWR